MDSIGNLLYLCLPCHREIHADESFAYSRGWMAYPGYEEITPVWVRGEFWALLRADGTYERLDPVDAVALVRWVTQAARSSELVPGSA